MEFSKTLIGISIYLLIGFLFALIQSKRKFFKDNVKEELQLTPFSKEFIEVCGILVFTFTWPFIIAKRLKNIF